MDYLEIYEAQHDIINIQEKLIRKMTTLLMQHELIDDIKEEMEEYHNARDSKKYQ